MSQQPIILITGTFDVLHPGHISLIKQAKKMGRVIAIVARDTTIQKVKQQKPLYSEQTRIQHLQDLELVDQIELGFSNNPYQVLDAYKPDIIVLGYDQKVFVDALGDEIAKRGLTTQVHRADSFYPEYFKSSKIKKALHDNEAGFFCINKPTDWTSHDVVAKARGLLTTKQIGHAGTLDPLATGVLILARGKATKLLDWWHFFTKTYVAELKFGKTSDTYDSEGDITSSEQAYSLTTEQISETLKNFHGNKLQTPPPFSAKKIQGKKAYELARAGKQVTLQPKNITIVKLELLTYSYPKATLHIECSSGTYIRSLIHDIGASLKTGAIMTKLERTAIGPIALQQCIELETIAKTKPYPVDQLIAELNKYMSKLD